MNHNGIFIWPEVREGRGFFTKNGEYEIMEEIENDPGINRVVVDISAIGEFQISALVVLLSTYKNLKDRGVDLLLIGVSEENKKIIKQASLLDCIVTY